MKNSFLSFVGEKILCFIQNDNGLLFYVVGGSVASVGAVSAGSSACCFLKPCTIPFALVSVISPPMIWFLYTNNVLSKKELRKQSYL